jgi:2-isopropylmalate synthase
MRQDFVDKYKRYIPLTLDERKWPSNIIQDSPVWCSVDLRDGNQALIDPMTIDQKLELFNLLVEIGFKEIEVGFPAAADVEFNFLRRLVNENLIPGDVSIQVLTQAREHLIKKTFESLEGVKKPIIHLYNSTSTLQRKVVFSKSEQEIIDLAVEGVSLIKSLSSSHDGQVRLEYSPESYSGTEPDFAVKICEAVMDCWSPTLDNSIILNLPATVEMTSPNYYADQVEYFVTNLKNRDKAIISLHTHNDRGTGVAATEMGLLAGGQRVEGTLFGNGERTGNVDIVTLALNMFTQGINPQLNFHDINKVAEIYERTTGMLIHQRHPYVGELVYTAFSGSHQDAINKGIQSLKDNPQPTWSVPYLPIDPSDLGRTYDSIIRINSQSGKGGVAYLMENEFGYKMPKTMHPEFARIIQQFAESTGSEISPSQIYEQFQREYLSKDGKLQLVKFKSQTQDDDATVICELSYTFEGLNKELTSAGNGPVDACKAALTEAGQFNGTIQNYASHSLSIGSDSQAVTYIQVSYQSYSAYGVGVHSNTQISSIKALFSAINRLNIIVSTESSVSPAG